MHTITKKILVDRIAAATGQKRTVVKEVIQDFLDQIVDELGEGNRIEFRDFGVFEVKNRAARTAQNPKTLERVPVPAKRSVRFKAGRRMRDVMDAVPPVTDAAAAPRTDGARADRPEVVIERDVAGTIGVRESDVASVR